MKHDTCSWFCINCETETVMKEQTGICQMCHKEKGPFLHMHKSMIHQDIACICCKSKLFETISKLKEYKEAGFKCNECEENFKLKKYWKTIK